MLDIVRCDIWLSSVYDTVGLFCVLNFGFLCFLMLYFFVEFTECVFVYTRGATQRYEEDQVVVRVTDEVDLVETIGSGSVLTSQRLSGGHRSIFWLILCLQSPFGVDRTSVVLYLLSY